MQRTEAQWLKASCWVRLIKAARTPNAAEGCSGLESYILLKAALTISVIFLLFVLWTGVMRRYLCTYVELFEDGVLFYSREHHSHGVGSILQEGNLHSIHVVGQLLDVCLQLCESCREEEVNVRTAYSLNTTGFWSHTVVSFAYHEALEAGGLG